MIKNDYKAKISNHLASKAIKKILDSGIEQEQVTNAINAFINFLNYSFREKNNFCISNFNKSNLKFVHISYNQMKNNFLSKDCGIDVFDDISPANLRLFKFIVFNLNLNQTDEQTYSDEINQLITVDDLNVLIMIFNQYLNV